MKKNIKEQSGFSGIEKNDSIVSILPDSNMQVILDHLLEHVIYQDRSMRILWANRAACDSVGKPRSELVGKHCYRIWPKRNSICPGCPVMKAIESGDYHRQNTLTPDGRTWMIQGYPLKDKSGEIVGGLEITMETTEKNRAEDSLRESEEKYRLLFANASEGIITLDIKGKLLDVNTKFSHMTGYAVDELVGKSALDLARLFRVSTRQVTSKFAGFVEGRTKRSDWTITTRDGEKLDITVFPSVIKKESKNIGISVMITDVTEQKKVQEALQQNERFLQNIFDSIQDGISVLDTDLTILRTNTWIEGMYQAQMPLVGKKCYQAYQNRDDMCPWCPSIKAIKTGKVYRETVPYPSEDDPERWIDLSAFPLMDKHGKVAGIIEHVKDITDKVMAEKALIESEGKYRNLIEQSNDAIYLLYGNRFEMINNRFTEMFGYTLEETNASDFNFRKLIAAKSMPAIEERVKRFSRGEELDPVYEFTAVAKSGREIECETSVTYVDYRGAKATQGIIRDITERKRSEQHIRRSMEEKELLLKEIHHRVKNNLQIISSLLSLQAQRIEDESALDAFVESRNRVHSMALVHEKLYKSDDFARIDFHGYVESMINRLLKTYSTGENISLDLDIHDVALGIDTAIPCGLILNEMISNSLKHAFPSGRKGHIRISLRKLDTGLFQLVFADDGVSMPAHIEISKAETMGLKLIHLLTGQIEGSLEIERDKGTAYTITFSGHQAK